jgi:hypothetical protein
MNALILDRLINGPRREKAAAEKKAIEDQYNSEYKKYLDDLEEKRSAYKRRKGLLGIDSSNWQNIATKYVDSFPSIEEWKRIKEI